MPTRIEPLIYYCRGVLAGRVRTHQADLSALALIYPDAKISLTCHTASQNSPILINNKPRHKYMNASHSLQTYITSGSAWFNRWCSLTDLKTHTHTYNAHTHTHAMHTHTTDTDTDTDTDGRQMDGRTDRRTDTDGRTPTDRPTDRQTDIQTHTHTHAHTPHAHNAHLSSCPLDRHLLVLRQPAVIPDHYYHTS
ncbi:hypothetical protein T492DRAFT_339556 [Pavlovales sp. CCMP2436]|nr:hypothetical protein T492DRAFT_339556 [Pavlovales sp. CCMP2436]